MIVFYVLDIQCPEATKGNDVSDDHYESKEEGANRKEGGTNMGGAREVETVWEKGKRQRDNYSTFRKSSSDGFSLS